MGEIKHCYQPGQFGTQWCLRENLFCIQPVHAGTHRLECRSSELTFMDRMGGTIFITEMRQASTVCTVALDTSSTSASPTTDTSSTSASPTTDPNAGDDPHVSNYQGAKFDVWTTGQLTLVRSPASASLLNAVFIVQGVVTGMSSKPCAPTYITQVYIGQRVYGTAMQSWSVTPQAAGDIQVMPEVSNSTSTAVRVQRSSSGVRFLVDTHAVSLQQAFAWGHAYLNVQVHGMTLSDGGLLGNDDYRSASEVPLQCQSLATHPKDTHANAYHMLSEARAS